MFIYIYRFRYERLIIVSIRHMHEYRAYIYIIICTPNAEFHLCQLSPYCHSVASVLSHVQLHVYVLVQ